MQTLGETTHKGLFHIVEPFPIEHNATVMRTSTDFINRPKKNCVEMQSFESHFYPPVNWLRISGENGYFDASLQNSKTHP